MLYVEDWKHHKDTAEDVVDAGAAAAWDTKPSYDQNAYSSSI